MSEPAPFPGWDRPAVPSHQMISLPAGDFWMGESADDKFANDTERPRRKIVFGHRFALASHPVTVAQYRGFRPDHAPNDPPDVPVVDVSFSEAVAYCIWLGERTGNRYRLPTEAEWEYGCRAGASSCFSCGSELRLDQANYLYAEDGARVGLGHRTPVGAYPANAYGLWDMHGNVSEFTADAWSPTYHAAPADGSARPSPEPLAPRTIRGGAWDHLPRLLRCSWRDFVPVSTRRDNLGFRLARTLP